jgi:hypothetical protein
VLVVHAYDRFNNSIIDGGEASLMYMQVDTPDNKPPDIATVVDNRDGTYNLLYTPTLTGTYVFTLVIQGFPVLPIIGSSFTASGTIRQVQTSVFCFSCYWRPHTPNYSVVNRNI